MKRFASYTVLVLILSAVLNVMAFGKMKKESLTFSRDTTVNGTVVKKGDYNVTFDDQTNEITIWQGKTALVKAQARLENRVNKVSKTTLNIDRKDNNEQVLTGITFAGEDKTLLLGSNDIKGANPLPPSRPMDLSIMSELR